MPPFRFEPATFEFAEGGVADCTMLSADTMDTIRIWRQVNFVFLR